MITQGTLLRVDDQDGAPVGIAVSGSDAREIIVASPLGRYTIVEIRWNPMTQIRESRRWGVGIRLVEKAIVHIDPEPWEESRRPHAHNNATGGWVERTDVRSPGHAMATLPGGSERRHTKGLPSSLGVNGEVLVPRRD